MLLGPIGAIRVYSTAIEEGSREVVRLDHVRRPSPPTGSALPSATNQPYPAPTSSSACHISLLYKSVCEMGWLVAGLGGSQQIMLSRSC